MASKPTRYARIRRYAKKKAAEQPTAEPFYSHAAKVIAEKIGGSASPDQVRKTLLNAGVKPEEMKWSGLDELLNSATGPVNKADLLAKAESLPKVNEIVKREKRGNGIKIGTAKYGQYQLPGGSNYREALYQLPYRDPFTEYLNHLQDKYGATGDDLRVKVTPEEDAKLDALNKARGGPSPNFKSSHWDEPNVLGHLRLKDYKGPNGEKLLHVDELQSDWHQAGRDKGYKTEFPADKKKRLEELRTHIKENMMGSLSTDEIRRSPEWNEFNRLNTEELDHKHGGVPDAPLKKTWHEHLLKRVLRHAAEGGYDGITWTPGEQQADRYDLSKHIDSLYHEKNDDGTYNIVAHKPGDVRDQGTQVIYKEDVEPHELEGMIGKELAGKVAAGEGEKPGEDDRYGSPYRDWRAIRGVNLKTGGEGMKGFYDKIVPDYLNKVGKKYGVKVGTTTLKTGDHDTEVHHFPLTDGHKKDLLHTGQAFYARRQRYARPMPNRAVRYARKPAVAEIHPELRHTRLGAVLREHASHDDDVGALARHAIAASPDHSKPLDTLPLHVMRDYMLEHPDHPLAKKFNWDNLPEKVELDQTLASEIADHNGKAPGHRHTLTGIQIAAPEKFSGERAMHVADVVGRVRAKHPWASDGDVKDSGRRLSQKYLASYFNKDSYRAHDEIAEGEGDEVAERYAREVKSSDKSDKGGLTKKGAKRLGIHAGSETKAAAKKAGGFAKVGGKTGKRRESFCARMCGAKAKSSAETRNDPDSRVNKALRVWGCRCGARKNSRHSDGCPVKYARNIEPHPLFARDGVNPWLSHLLTTIAADEHKYPESGEMATVILGGGHVDNLPALGEALKREGHPHAATLNWKRAPRAVKMDHAILSALIDSNMGRHWESSVNLSEIGSLPPATQAAVLTQSHSDFDGERDRITRQVMRKFPDATEPEVSASRQRLAERAGLLRRDAGAEQYVESHNKTIERGGTVAPWAKAFESTTVALPPTKLPKNHPSRLARGAANSPRARYDRESHHALATARGEKQFAAAAAGYAGKLRARQQPETARFVHAANQGGYARRWFAERPERAVHVSPAEDGGFNVGVTHAHEGNPNLGFTFVHRFKSGSEAKDTVAKLVAEGHTPSSAAAEHMKARFATVGDTTPGSKADTPRVGRKVADDAETRVLRKSRTKAGVKKYAAKNPPVGVHGTPSFNPTPVHAIDTSYRESDPLWGYHRGLIGFNGKKNDGTWGKPGGNPFLRIQIENDAADRPAGISPRHIAEGRWRQLQLDEAHHPDLELSVGGHGEHPHGIPSTYITNLGDYLRGHIRREDVDGVPDGMITNAELYTNLFDAHGGGRRPWYDAIFPLQDLSHHAEPHDEYRLLANSVRSGNRHALPELVKTLRERDNPSGWWPGWSRLAKAMEERTGDLKPDHVAWRVGGIAKAVAGMSTNPDEHSAIAEHAAKAAAAGDFVPYMVLADHMDDHGIPQYANVLRTELQNVLPESRPVKPKGRRRFSRTAAVAKYAKADAPRSLLDAIQRVRGSGQKALHAKVRQVAAALKLDPTKTRDAVHDGGGAAFPGIAQAVYAKTDPATARYAAAWSGLLTQAPSLTVFHAGPGPDSVYKFSHAGSAEKITAALDASGIPKRTLMPTKSGYDVLVYDPGRKLRDRVAAHARQNGVPVQESTGTGEVVGGPDAAAARAAFRKTISEYESGRPSTKMSRKNRTTIMKFGRNHIKSHPDYKALLAHVLEVPGDLPVFADWLEERGLVKTARVLRHADGIEVGDGGKLVPYYRPGSVTVIHPDGEPLHDEAASEEKNWRRERDYHQQIPEIGDYNIVIDGQDWPVTVDKHVGVVKTPVGRVKVHGFSVKDNAYHDELPDRWYASEPHMRQKAEEHIRINHEEPIEQEPADE